MSRIVATPSQQEWNHYRLLPSWRNETITESFLFKVLSKSSSYSASFSLFLLSTTTPQRRPTTPCCTLTHQLLTFETRHPFAPTKLTLVFNIFIFFPQLLTYQNTLYHFPYYIKALWHWLMLWRLSFECMFYIKLELCFESFRCIIEN